MTLRGILGAAALALAAAAGAAAAQTPENARVRAGEHAAYSRIAVDVSRLEDWSVRRSGRRLIVSFPERELNFDTRQIFPLRRVTRVSNARGRATEAGSTLTLSMTCDCEAQAYRFDDDMLVIDIRAKDAPSREPSPRPASDRASAQAEATTEAAAVATAPSAATPGETGNLAANAPSRPSGALQPAPDDDPNQRVGDLREPADPLPDDIREAQRILLEQLSRAADQGLVRFREGVPADPEAADPVEDRQGADGLSNPRETTDSVEARSPRETGAAAGAEPSDPASPSAPSMRRSPVSAESPTERTPGDLSPQLSASTAFDSAAPAAREPSRPARCREEDWLDTASWGEDGDFYEQLAERRARLIEEFDRPSREASLDLARLYLRFGFGAEARQRLIGLPSDDAMAALVRDASYVVEGERPRSDGVLASMGGCVGNGALWRAAGGLSPDPGERDDAESRKAFLRAFESLPVGMRRLLGPKALDRLIFEGELDLAESVRLLLDRAAGDHGDAWRLAAGRLAVARGEQARGEAMFLRVAEGRDDVAAEALLALADLRMSRNDVLDQGLVEALGVASTARAGTLLGRRLLVAEILGRAGRSELGAALDVIEAERRGGGRRDDDLKAAMRRILIESRAEEVEAAAYAAAILEHLERFDRTADWDEARVAVARQLSLIGLGNAADGVLGPALARGVREARIAGAEAKVAIGDSAGALALLSRLEDPEAERVRAQAFAAEGRHAAALDALRRAGVAPADEPELAWRAGEWQSAREVDGSARSGLATWLSPNDEQDSSGGPLAPIADLPDAPTLSSARSLLEASQNARAVIEEALDDG